MTASTDTQPGGSGRGAARPDTPVMTVTIDGVAYHFVRLRWRERNRVVHRGVDVDARGIELRPTSFADALLAASLTAVVRDGKPQPVTRAWLDEVPVALGEQLVEAAVRLNRRQRLAVEEGPGSERGTTVRVYGTAYRLAPWTWGMRNRLLEQAIRGESGGGAIDTALFHEHVLAGTCVSIEGRAPARTWLDELDADVGDALLEHILQSSALDDEGTRDLVEAVHGGRAHDGITLYTLCREFGWTPAELRAQRAVDIDVLMTVHRALHERPAEPSGGTPAMHGSASNETVIMIEDDPESTVSR